MIKNNKQNLIIYQTKSGEIKFRGDFDRDTVWGSLNQIAELFDIDKSGVSRHIKNIFKSGELNENSTVAKIATVQKEGDKKVKRDIEYFNLDVILSVGYRVDSKQATQFRIWATKTLKKHLVDGYTINKKRIGANYQKFLKAVADVKALLPAGNRLDTKDVLELINSFAETWFSLDAYDMEKFPKDKITKKQISFTAEELSQALLKFKQELTVKKQATEIFGQERNKNSVEGIVGNVFQSFAKKDLYPNTEDKASHLLYFMVKNHPFVDGNKRSGAFAFVWFLRKSGVLRASLTPEALTALTLLVAESNPKDKDKITKLIILLLKK
ncbi:MAG: virulence protein RhuM/Fic/DOC family protein [Candidatus Pacebacteria bacterium]|nr:virulence protein RhuM/Fic/DOC family protein [Candidatus Paceibacterota bacterium]